MATFEIIRGNNSNSGSGGVTSVTYSELVALINTSGLTQGAQYLITNAASSQNIVSYGLLLTATSTNTISASGVGGFLNADFDKDGVYSGVSGYTLYNGTDKNGGIWTVAKELVLINGNVIIWNCLHYKVISAASFNGTDPATNTTAYSLLSKSTTNGYLAAWDFIIYCFEDDYLEQRADDIGNIVSDSSYAKNQSIQNFQWGRKLCLTNIVSTEGAIDCRNALGAIEANTITSGGGALVEGNGPLYYCKISNGAVVEVKGTSPNGITYCTLSGTTTFVEINNCTALINNSHFINGSFVDFTNATGNGTGDFDNNFIDATTIDLTGHDFAAHPVVNQTIYPLAQFADNTAALAGNLLVGAQYRVTGTGDIKVVI